MCIRDSTRVGLKFDIVPADNGYFGGEYCHEFDVECEVGESKYFVSEDGNYIAHEDVAELDVYKRQTYIYRSGNTILVGVLFLLW